MNLGLLQLFYFPVVHHACALNNNKKSLANVSAMTGALFCVFFLLILRINKNIYHWLEMT